MPAHGDCYDRSTASRCPRAAGRSPTPARTVARRIGRPTRGRCLCEIGVSQQEVINYALGGSWRPDRPIRSSSSAARRGRGSATGASKPTTRTGHPTTCSPGHRTSSPPSRSPPAWSGRRCSSTRSLRTRSPHADAALAERQRADVAALWARFNAVAVHNPEAAFPQPRDAAVPSPPRAAQPAARLPLQPVALQPVDGQPGLSAADLLGRAGAAQPASARTLALPPCGAALVTARSR